MKLRFNSYLCVYLLIFLLPFQQVAAKVIFPAVFADNMVLQQQTKIKIWGWADPWETAAITVSWSGEEFKIKGDGNASWSFFVDTPAAGGPYSISVKGKDQDFAIHNILIGEVWICAGQSNMEWSARHGVKDALDELPKAKQPDIRLFKMQKRGAGFPQDDVPGTWAVCDSASLYNFSGVGYFFGKELKNRLNVPIGLIDMAWGGSYIESWIPSELLELYPEAAYSAKIIPPSNYWPKDGGSIYNGMINPIRNYKTAGVIWYQGESNVHYPAAYELLQKTMVDHWRQVNDQNFPFYYVQIAPYINKLDSTGLQSAFIREMQWKAMSQENTGMVVTTDQVDNLSDVHPLVKGVIGRRLAAWALNEHYKTVSNPYKSPAFRHLEIKRGKALISFDHVSVKGIEFRNKQVKEFEIAGEDRVFYPAKAKIVKGRQLEVWSDQVKRPVAVRFAFRNAPEPTLFDKSGLPVVPFRTDEW